MLCDARVDISSKGTSRIKLQPPETRKAPDLKLQSTNKRRDTFGAWILVVVWILDCWIFVRGGQLPLEVPILDPIVVAIANQQQRLALPRIQRNSVTGVEFSLLGTGPTKGLQKFALFVELENIVRAVSISDENGTVWRDRDSARLEP